MSTVNDPLWKQLKQRVAANDLLRMFRVTRPAVPIHDIVRGLGVQLHEVPNPGWSGAVNSNVSTAAIWVRVGDSLARQRFTIAHELGHLLLHEAGAEYRDDTFRGTPKEYQANDFAADLLMPLWMLDPVAASFGRDPGRLAGIFQVSEQAMKIRLGRLVGA
jgi:hypothetical protein